MAKVITISRTFPDYHPRKGQPTYFVEQILTALLDLKIYTSFHSIARLNQDSLDDPKSRLTINDIIEFWEGIKHDTSIGQKLHTIRAKSVNKKTGETYSRWKQGEKVSLRVWSGKPYNSPQIIIAPDVELKKVYDFELDINAVPSVNGEYWHLAESHNDIPDPICINDGLSEIDFYHWFVPKGLNSFKGFKGQILCWKEVDYV